MSTLYRLKAYFGMVPPEDMDAYADAYGYEPEYDYDDTERTEQMPGPPQAREVGTQRARHDPRTVAERATVGISGSSRSGHHPSPPVHGALAVDAEPAGLRAPSPVVASLSSSGSAPGGSLPLSRITTVHPRSYNEARTIGERYREGIPVIINLTELDDAAAKRLVDFAAGLAFALRGSIDKVTSRVFLLSPAGVDVSAEERRKLAERGFFGQE
ncbi:MAG: cell division protein SepF [Actinomycetota bacterium]|nr:cell division protein SepF [Actinomycetota bacterium]